MSIPVFSICHATARTANKGWQASHDAWMLNADNRERVQYVLSVHVDDYNRDFTHSPMVIYGDRRDSVAGWNHAASISTGSILILNADDFFPPPHWDSLLLSKIAEAGHLRQFNADPPQFVDEFAIHTDFGYSGTDCGWVHNLMALGIISRPLYLKWGYALYPEYESMYSDNDMTEHAYQDGVVIEAFDLVFEHRHPAFGKAQMDEVYRKQNRPEAYELGKRVLERRRACKFKE